MKNKKNVSIATIIIAVIALFYQYTDQKVAESTGLKASEGPVEALYASRRSDVIVEVGGEVMRLLADDTKGSRHQKFIMSLASGHTVLISHNIDLAPRVEQLRQGDAVSVKGEYEWTERGGVIHWTHHDPAGKHTGGWVEHNGKRYE